MSHLFINGTRATIHERQFAHFHGESVFTTLRARNGALVLWQDHWQRLIRHAQFLGVSMPDEHDVLNQIHPHLGVNDKIRIIIARNLYAVIIEPYTPPPSTIYDGVSVVMSSWQTHPVLGRYKTGNSLPYQMALKEAHTRGAFEALLSNTDGFIVDGARTSIIHFDGTHIIALDGGLDGCMRAFILKTLMRYGMRVDTRFLRGDDLMGQLLLSNSLIGLVPVAPIKFPETKMLVDMFRMDNKTNTFLAMDFR
jgi:branched-subunit amino acid aminotransferase/4-amino-4-deoxychorismate lyase